MRQKTLKQERRHGPLPQIGPGSYYLPVVVPKDATDEQVEIACQAALAVSEEESYVFGD